MEEVTPTTFVDIQEDIETVVGDEQQPDFLPRIKIKKWDNEVNLSVGLITDEAGEMGSFEDLVRWDGTDIAAVFYPAHDTAESGGYEFEIHLLARPDSNIVPLSVQTKELSFHYQPFEVMDGAERPEEILGSYAAYHVSKDSNEYQTGKAFHIYRPWAEDDNGWRVWCEFDPDWDGIGNLNITVPQNFIDTAVYPIIIDPTFGYTSAGATTYTAASSEGVFGTFATGAAGTVVSISYFSPSGAGNINASNVGLYKGDDFYKVCETPSPPSIIGATNGWITVGLNLADIQVCPYLPSFYLDNSSSGFSSAKYDTVTDAGYSYTGLGSAGVANSTMPTQLAGSVNSNKWSIYATYNASPITKIANEDTGTAASSTVSGTYTQATVRGNMLIAAVYCNVPTGATSISGWTVVQDLGINSNASSIVVLAKIADGTETTVTATCTSSSASRIQIYEYSGINATSVSAATDALGTGTTGTTSTNTETGALTTTNANDLVFIAAGFTTNSSAWGWTGTPSVATLLTNARMMTGAVIISATGTYAPILSWTSNTRSTLNIVAFKQLNIVAGARLSTMGVG